VLGRPITLLDEPGRDDNWRRHIFDVEKLDTVCASGRHTHRCLDYQLADPWTGRGVRGWSTIARDISDRRKAEEVKDGFLTLVSHELRTPLSAIIAHVELLLDDDLSDPALGLSR
jgi:signal transduction histidine kinase